jgi:hypothetical protein
MKQLNLPSYATSVAFFVFSTGQGGMFPVYLLAEAGCRTNANQGIVGGLLG